MNQTNLSSSVLLNENKGINIQNEATIDKSTATKCQNVNLENKTDNNCECCDVINELHNVSWQFIQSYFNSIKITECKCSSSKCCCQKKFSHIKNMFVNKDRNLDGLLQDFFLSESNDKGEFYTCKICFKYLDEDLKSSKLKRPKSDSVFITSIKKHLKLEHHKKAIILHNIATIRGNSLPTVQCNENQCIAAQFMASLNLPSQLYPELYDLLDKIMSNITVDNNYLHPLGNRHQFVRPIVKQACIEAVHEKFKKEVSCKTFCVTGLKKKFMLAVNTGSSRNEAIVRQIIIANFIGEKGMIEEFLISVAVITDHTGSCTKNSLKSVVSKIIPTKNIAIISTNADEMYVENEIGMIDKIKNDNDFCQKIIHIMDICHKIEELLLYNKQNWISETIFNCLTIVGEINFHPNILQMLNTFSADSNYLFHGMESNHPTGYIEYVHVHLKYLVLNIEILLNFLQSVLYKDLYKYEDFDGTAYSIFKSITNSKFVARLILLNNIFHRIAALQKKAQSVSFGPFDYLNIITDLKKILCGEHFNIERLSFLGNGKLNYIYEFIKSCPRIAEYNEQNETMDLTTIIKEYNDWIDQMFLSIEQHISMPPPILLIAEIFDKCNCNVESYKKFLKLINIEFLTCSKICLGIEFCECVDNQFKTFYNHLWSLPMNDLKEKIAYYLSVSNLDVVLNLNIPNVLRMLEIIQLFKGSPSATERVMTVIKKMVQDKLENTENTANDNVDTVGLSTIMHFYSKFDQFDSKLASKKLDHLESLLK